MPFLGNIGAGEMLVIGIVFLLLFGTKKMNEMARGLGASTKELKKAKQEWKKTINDMTKEADEVSEEIKTSIKDSVKD